MPEVWGFFILFCMEMRVWCGQQGYAKKIFLSTFSIQSCFSVSILYYDTPHTTELWVNLWLSSWTAVVSFILWKLTHLRVFQDQYNQSSGYSISKLRHTCICRFHLKKTNWLLTLHPPPFWAYLSPFSFSCAVYPSSRILGWSLVFTCKKSWSLFRSYNTN